MNSLATRLTLLAIPLLLGLAGCVQRPPTVEFNSMTIQQLTLDSASYMAVCQVSNPNGHPLQIGEVRWSLTSGETEIASGSANKNVELPPRRSIPLNVYFQVPRRLLDAAGLGSRRQFNYEFQGQVQFASPVGPMKAKFAASGRMPIMRRLGLTLARLDVLGTSESRVGLALEGTVTNTNDLFLTPTALDGELFVKDRPLVTVHATLADAEPIAPGQTVRLRVPVWASSPEVGVRTLSTILTTQGADLHFVGALMLRLPGAGVGDVSDLLSPSTAPDDGADSTVE